MSDLPYIGIDFGTSNSATCWINPKSGMPEVIRNEHGEEKTPSAVYWGVDGILVGRPVLDQLADVGHMDEVERTDVLGRTVVGVKRLLKANLPLALPGGEIVTPVEIAAEILRSLKHSAENGCFNGETVEAAVIAHPIRFGKMELSHLKEAAALAGFARVQLVQEPVAAIKGFVASGAKTGKGILVFDFGGGTLDLAYLVQEDDGSFHMPVAPLGETIGGDDFDQLIYDHFEHELKRQHGTTFSLHDNGEINLAVLQECRKAKEKLTTQNRARLSHILVGSNKSVIFQLEQKKLEALIENVVCKAVHLAEKMISSVNNAGFDVNSVVLVGGSTRTPIIRDRLQKVLPVKPDVTMHADMAVAMGAGIQEKTSQISGVGAKDNEDISVYTRQCGIPQASNDETIPSYSKLHNYAANTINADIIINEVNTASTEGDRGDYAITGMINLRFQQIAKTLNGFPWDIDTVNWTGIVDTDDSVAKHYMGIYTIMSLLARQISTGQCIRLLDYFRYYCVDSRFQLESGGAKILIRSAGYLNNTCIYPPIFAFGNGTWGWELILGDMDIPYDMNESGQLGVVTLEKYVRKYDELRGVAPRRYSACCDQEINPSAFKAK